MKFNLLLYYCYSNMSQRLRGIIGTSISCLTEHDKNEVYQSVSIDVSIGYLDWNTLCIVMFSLFCLR